VTRAGGEAIQDLNARVGLAPETDLHKWLPRVVLALARGKDQAPERSRRVLKERDKDPQIAHRLRPARAAHRHRPVRALQLATDPAVVVGPALSAVQAAVPAPEPKAAAALPAGAAVAVVVEAAAVADANF
jgi:hypothetical protein